MKIAVTGAAGFIGSHVAERLAELGHEVIGIDDFTEGVFHLSWNYPANGKSSIV